MAARPMMIHVKPGASYDGTVADYKVCNKAFVDPTARPPMVPLRAPLAAQAGAAAATGFMQGYMEAKARAEYVDTCMSALGYTKIDMTPGERAAVKGLKGEPAKKTWFDAFFNTDLSARIAAVSTATSVEGPPPKP
ncbi:hypothetical protein [Caulobacter sp. DWR2-3-1b2]|uniref:hypothetical protein n=2 Tax=Caulobacter TaxID=75 RepID=UPI003CF2D5D2